jgi:hypothetical protein
VKIWANYLTFLKRSAWIDVRIFRKQLRPEDLGALLYEALRKGMESQGDLSLARFLESLDADPEELDEQYVGEAMMGLMFGGVLAIERSASRKVSEQILAGMKTEFLNHIAEQGASQIEQAEWDTIIASRFLEYRRCMEDYSGFEPPWKLGRLFYWNIVGRESFVAMSVKISTLYLLAARDMCQTMLNEHGPSLFIAN